MTASGSSAPAARADLAVSGASRSLAGLVSAVLGAGLLLVALLLPLATRALLGDDTYWIQVLIWVMFFAYLSAAWNLIGGFAGQYSIGHAGLVGIGAYTSSVLAIQAGLTPWLGMLVGGALAAVVGGVIGYPCFRLRGTFFSLVTIAFAEMLRVGLELTDRLGPLEINGVRGLLLPVLGDRPGMFQFTGKRPYYYVMLGLLLAVLAAGFAVKRSRLGYYLAAIRDDEDAVAALGVSPARAKLVAMMLSSFFAAIGGTFYAQLVGFITPTRTMSLDFSVQMVIMAVLGGIGTVLGPLWGAMVLVPVAELTRAFWGGSLQGVHLIVYGALLVLVILYWPQGIDPWVRRGVHALARACERWRAVPVAAVSVENAPRIALPAGGLLGARLSPNGAGPLLSLRDLSKSFGGAVGVRGVSLDVARGEVVGIIGANGAGKTTLFNLVTGALAPDGGEIQFAGRRLAHEGPDARNRLGIARTFQIVRPFAGMTTLENTMVAALPRVASVAEARREAARYLEFVGLAHRLDVPASGLSTGERKRLELARALATRPRLLLLDEVTGGVDQRSLPGLVRLIQKVRGEGLTLLVIEHNLRVISAVADRLVMLHLGQKLKEGAPTEVVSDPEVVQISWEAPLLDIDGLEVSYGGYLALSGVSLRVQAGEVVCLMGANGSGKSSLLNAVSGLVLPRRGTVSFNGEDVTVVPTYRRLGRGLAHVLERRRLFPYMTVQENLLLGAYLPDLRPARGATLERIFAMFPVLRERRRQLASTLSGGEQQMVAIGRALMSRPRFVMLDEPFLGLSPRLVLEVSDTIQRIAAEGVTVLFTEQAIQQSLAISHRGYILESGRLALTGTSGDLLANDLLQRVYMGLDDAAGLDRDVR